VGAVQAGNGTTEMPTPSPAGTTSHDACHHRAHVRNALRAVAPAGIHKLS
jgi:hypothetical protein